MSIGSIDIIMISKCKYSEPSIVEQHCHDFYHLIYVLGGSGKINVEDNKEEALENYIYILKPGVPHGIISCPSVPLQTIEVKFGVSCRQIDDKLNRLPYKICNDNKRVKMILVNILNEAISKSSFYKEIINLNFTEFLLRLIRSLNVRNSLEGICNNTYLINENNNKNENEILRSVLHYINNNYNKKITLEKLAQISMLNQAYLCRIFSKEYGISPIQYINN